MALLLVDTTRVEELARLYWLASDQDIPWAELDLMVRAIFVAEMHAFLGLLRQEPGGAGVVDASTWIVAADERISQAITAKLDLEPGLRDLLRHMEGGEDGE